MCLHTYTEFVKSVFYKQEFPVVGCIWIRNLLPWSEAPGATRHTSTWPDGHCPSPLAPTHPHWIDLNPCLPGGSNCIWLSCPVCQEESLLNVNCHFIKAASVCRGGGTHG